MMKKNGKGKPVRAKKEAHLIEQLAGSKPAKEETREQEEVAECRYGIFCAHLRAAGCCALPHRRHHYLLLNLVPPADHLPDPEDDEQDGKASKRERKERKILEKTISQHIDVAALAKQEQLNKEHAIAEIKQQFLQNMNELERQVAEVVSAASAEEYFVKLNEARASGSLFELKKRSMIQLKKKSEQVYKEIIDKEYRIANRLIKESLKDAKHSLLEIYQDINHNTVPSVRQYFEAYLQPDEGVLLQNPAEKCHLTSLLHSIFLREPAQFKHQYCLLARKSTVGEIVSNVEFFNLMVPFLHAQGQPFNKYLLVDCQQDLSLASASQLLARDYALTFHVKCKPAPEFPFGQLAANLEKFGQWAAKTASKYRETNKDSNVVLVLNNIEHLFANPAAQQFEQEKLKERRETFRKIVMVLQPVVYFLTTSASQEARQAVGELLETGKGKSEGKLHLFEQK